MRPEVALMALLLTVLLAAGSVRAGDKDDDDESNWKSAEIGCLVAFIMLAVIYVALAVYCCMRCMSNKKDENAEVTLKPDGTPSTVN